MLVGLLMVLGQAEVTDASTVVRTGETVSVTSDQVVEGDFYVAAGTASISGEITGDFLVVAGSVTANGSVSEDMLAVGGSVQYHASVTDDVRIIAGDATIAGPVGGDLVVLSGVLKVLSTASVAGDILFFGGDAEISGPVGGSVLGVSEKIRIDAPVAGNVDVTSSSVVFGDRAVVAGDVRYTSPQELIRSQSAVIEGSVVKNENAKAAVAAFSIESVLIPFLILLFTSLVLYLLFKRPLIAVVDAALEKPLITTFLGSATVILTPFIIAILFVGLLTSLLGTIILVLALLFSMLAAALSGVVAGAILSKLIVKQVHVDLLWIVTGTVTLHLLLIIPIVGVVLAIGVFLATLGSLLYCSYLRAIAQ